MSETKTPSDAMARMNLAENIVGLAMKILPIHAPASSDWVHIRDWDNSITTFKKEVAALIDKAIEEAGKEKK